jgi:hypothetical protein
VEPAVEPLALGLGGVALPAAPQPSPDELEYLVKWKHKSHAQNEWMKESVVLGMARRKLMHFKKRHGAQPCLLVEPHCLVPECLVTRRPCPAGPGWEILIKWSGMGYEEASWEVRGISEYVSDDIHGLVQEALNCNLLIFSPVYHFVTA